MSSGFKKLLRRFFIKRYKICRDANGYLIEEPKNYIYLDGKRIQLRLRPPHATVSIITHRQDFAKMDEYLKDSYTYKPKALTFEQSWQQVFNEMNLQFHKTKRSIYYECIAFGGNSIGKRKQARFGSLLFTHNTQYSKEDLQS